jgi:hypothetical protein
MKTVKRWLVILAGSLITLIGLILMPVPGPGGTPVTLAGLAILATELPAARRLKERFLAFRAKYYETLTPAGRKAAVTGVLFFYAFTSTAGYFIVQRLKQQSF